MPWVTELKHEHGTVGLTGLRLHRHVSCLCTRYILGFCVRTTMGRSDRNTYRLSASEKIHVSFAVVQSVVQSPCSPPPVPALNGIGDDSMIHCGPDKHPQALLTRYRSNTQKTEHDIA